MDQTSSPSIVSVLFCRPDSVYKTLAGVDPWDKDRDARNFGGPGPVVAHPPCAQWASLRHCAKSNADEKALALFAVEMVRRFGGVLEHPMQSSLFKVAGLPGSTGWIHPINQNWFGHRAKKATLLYIVGCAPRDIPPFPITLGKASHTVGLWSRRDKQNCRPSIAKWEFEHTPPAFAEWLIQLARQCKL